MSQSPITDFSPARVQQYKNGWGALSRLLHADHSFSGDEKHSAFLNLDGKRFADISALSGFNFAEDGRALITDDWDLDGDLDIWVASRTAPRLRLLENKSNNDGKALFIRLHGNGTTSNLDAIGAKCEVWLKGDEKPIIRTLKGGDSFLSQTGSWLHFGLGQKASISKVIVHWPAGKQEEFTGLVAEGRYLLHQGASKAKLWTKSLSKKIARHTPLQLPFESDEARIVVLTPKLIPLLENQKGTAIAEDMIKGPTLINLWSHTCPSCLHELKEWTNNVGKIKSNGLNIIALNTDLTNDVDNQEAANFISKIGFPFKSFTTNGDTLQRLDLFQRSFLDRWIPLPVPTSFLLDKNGKVVVIYKGPVTTDTIIADMKLLDAPAETLRHHATPFNGLWVSPAPFSSPKRYIKQLLDHQKVNDTERYYKRFVDVELRLPNPPTAPVVEGLKTLASISSHKKDFNQQVNYLKQAVALVPQAKDLQTLLQKALFSANQTEKKSLENLLAKVAAEPKNGKAHLALADLQRAKGLAAEAVESYKNALKTDPSLSIAAGKLSWLLATHTNPKVRHPQMALSLANRLMEMNGGKDPNFFDLQAVALAANGDFKAAIEKTNSALKLLKEGSPYKRGIETRLKLYKVDKPYFEKIEAK